MFLVTLEQKLPLEKVMEIRTKTHALETIVTLGMKKIGRLKSKFLSKESIEEGITYLTRVAKRNKWTPKMNENWDKVLSRRAEVVDEIYGALNSKTYVFHPFTIFVRYEKTKRRVIYASRPEDQIVDYILDNCLKYVFMEKKKIIHKNAYGSIKGRGQHELRKKVIDKVHNKKHIYVACCDTRQYYPTIKHDVMMKYLRQHIKDEWCLWLCEATISRMPGNSGMALGLATSNILGHVYHAAIDWTMTVEYGMKDYYRFCDDKIMISRDKNYLHGMVRVLRSLIEDVGQTMKHNWAVVRCDEARFEFLGALINSRNAILKSSARRRIERRFKKEQKKEFILERDWARPMMTWAGIRGGLRDVEVRNLIRHWVLKQYPEFFTRLWRSMEFVEQRRLYGGDLSKINVPLQIPTEDENLRIGESVDVPVFLIQPQPERQEGLLGKDYFHLDPLAMIETLNDTTE